MKKQACHLPLRRTMMRHHFDGDAVTFKQDPESLAYSYVLGSGKLEMGDYYYNPKMGNFCAIQHVLHPAQLNNDHRKVVATNNPKYESIFKNDI